MATPAIETADVTRVYKVRRKWSRAPGEQPPELTALAGVSLQVRAGELFGFLGDITEPTSPFQDKPTLGPIVPAARTLRGFVRSWLGGQASRTLLLTTHYMVEADELCDRSAVIDRGRVLACDTPAGLKRRVQQ